MKTHDLKCDADQFQLLLSGKKKFEARFNDRDFKEGDVLILHEQGNDEDPGRKINCLVTHVMTSFCSHWGLGDIPSGLVIMSVLAPFLIQPEIIKKDGCTLK